MRRSRPVILGTLARVAIIGATFSEDHRYWQDRFDTRRIADRVDELLVADTIDAHAKQFIEARDMFFLAHCDDTVTRNAPTRAARRASCGRCRNELEGLRQSQDLAG